MTRWLPALALLAAAPPTAGQSCPLQEAKLLPADGATSDRFGSAVAIEGSLAVIGADEDDDLALNSGSAYLFDAATGQELFKLLADDGAGGDWFGQAVAIDGTTVAVGSLSDDNGNGAGSVYLFDGTTGLQTAKLLADDGEILDYLGWSVAIRGGVVLAGARGDDDNGSRAGAAYVFDVATGTQLLKLLAADGAAYDELGSDVDMDGGTAIVGAVDGDGNEMDSGAVYAFDLVTGQQTAKLVANDGESGDNFGYDVAICGTTVIVGAWGEDDNGQNAGAAYLFDVVSGSQIAKLLPEDGAALDAFGVSVAIDGAVAAVGASGDDGSGAATGSVYLFDVATGLQTGKVVAAEGGQSDSFGVALALEGTTVLIGASGDEDNGPGSGSAYLFEAAFAPTSYCTAKANSQGCPTAIGGSGTPSASDPTPFDVTAAPVINNRNGILFYGVSGRAAIPLSGGILCAQPPLRRTGFQNAFGSPPPAVDCTGAFAFDFNAWAQSGVDPFLVAGQVVNAQYWWRDPAQPDGTGVALTDALEFALCP